MGMLLCEQNVRDVWIRNESGGQKLVKFCTRTDTHPHTHTHTTAAKLVVMQVISDHLPYFLCIGNGKAKYIVPKYKHYTEY